MKNIALVCGGYSGEYVISLQSAQQVYENLKNDYNIYKIIITKDGWYYDNNNERISIDKNDFSLTLNKEKICFDAAFIIVHGTPGENGLLQGYFDMMGLPYNTCDALTSAVTFDKQTCNSVVRSLNLGVSVAKNLTIYKDEKFDIDAILNEIALPVFVKPSQGGSSLGTFKVMTQQELLPAIQKAFEVHPKVLIEQFIEGREFSCGVMTVNGEVKALPVAEICPETEFFDWQAKYKGLSKEIVPAPVDEVTTLRIQKAAQMIYQSLNCKGVCRIDFIWNGKTDALYFLEVNTTPGQSKESIVPKQIRSIGKDVHWLYKTQVEEMLK